VLAGPLSAPVEIETKNTFPPAIPTGLAAVGTAGENGAGNEARPSIDLNWQPNTEPDLAGYVVYRREGSGEWQRISPAQPVVGSAFHDANVTAGHTYQYAVSAVDQEGHESARSAEAEETAPQQ
jgi:fibronectin type 3 domain-containing protein